MQATSHTTNISPLYRRAPKGNHADPRIMPFARCWQMACSDPSAAMRRVAVLHYPTILDTWMEDGMDRRTIAAVLGFSHWNKLRFWLWDNAMLDGFMEAYRDTADLFHETASTLELHAAGVVHPSVAYLAHRYRHFSPRDLRRMAGRNNPDKYTTAGKLRATPAPPTGKQPALSTVKFTGSWSLCTAA